MTKFIMAPRRRKNFVKSSFTRDRSRFYQSDMKLNNQIANAYEKMKCDLRSFAFRKSTSKTSLSRQEMMDCACNIFSGWLQTLYKK